MKPFSMTAGLRYTKEDRDYLPDQFIQEMPLGGLPFLVLIAMLPLKPAR